MARQRAPALPDSPTFQQLWDALASYNDGWPKEWQAVEVKASTAGIS